MRYFLSVLFLVLFSFAGHAQKLRIAVAANAQYVAKKLQEAFQKETGMETELVVSSSGKLTAQIRQGAPYHVFLSADLKYPQTLYQEGLTTGNPTVYAHGVLVLWSQEAALLKGGVSALTNPAVKRIAIGNPKTAPYGEAARQVLQKQQLLDKVRNKLVYGESISQVNQYLLAGAVQVAFTSKSVVLEPALQGKGSWQEVDAKLYAPLAQGVVVLKSAKGTQAQQAQRFYQFLFSPQAKAIFKAYGYR